MSQQQEEMLPESEGAHARSVALQRAKQYARANEIQGGFEARSPARSSVPSLTTASAALNRRRHSIWSVSSAEAPPIGGASATPFYYVIIRENDGGRPLHRRQLRGAGDGERLGMSGI